MLCPEEGNSWSQAAAPCSECGFYTNSCFKLCDACSISLAQCNLCRQAVPVAKALQQSVLAAIRRRNKALAAAQLSYQRVIAPYKNAVDSYESATEAAIEKYNSACAEAREAVARTSAELTELERPKPSPIDSGHLNLPSLEETLAARERFNQAQAAAGPAMEAAWREFNQTTVRLDQSFEHRSHYQASKEALGKRILNATRLFDARLDYLTAKAQLEQDYRLRVAKLKNAAQSHIS